MQISTSLLSFHKKEPSQGIAKIKVGDTWAVLHQPIAKWDKDLLNEYQQDLYFLFPDQFKVENYHSKDIVCLCSTITNCPKKKLGQLENRDCTEYRRGLCVEASVEANDCQPLSLGSIARFHGFSKQRAHQIYTSARKRLIMEMAHDEVIQEYLADVFLGKETLPTADDIVALIEKAVHEESD